MAPINAAAPKQPASDISNPSVAPAADTDANGYSSVAADYLAAVHRFGETAATLSGLSLTKKILFHVPQSGMCRMIMTGRQIFFRF